MVIFMELLSRYIQFRRRISTLQFHVVFALGSKLLSHLFVLKSSILFIYVPFRRWKIRFRHTVKTIISQGTQRHVLESDLSVSLILLSEKLDIL